MSQKQSEVKSPKMVACPHCGRQVELLEKYNLIGYHGPGYNDKTSPICGGAWAEYIPSAAAS